MEELKGVEMEFTLDKIVFQKDGFKIARVYSKTNEIKKLLHPIYSNISIKGVMPELRSSIVYKATIESSEKNQYGTTLTVNSVYPRDFNSDNITTDDAMMDFVSVFIGEGTAEKLRGTKGICKMIQEKDISSLVKIKGIGEKIAEKLTSTYERDVVGSKYLLKIKKLGFSENEIKKLKNTFEDNLQVAYEVIKNNIFKLVDKGFRLDRMDGIFLEGLNGKKDNKNRIKAYIKKGLWDFLYDGYKSYATLDQFYHIEVMENITYNVGNKIVNQCVKEMIEEGMVKVLDNKIITTAEEYFIEQRLDNLLLEMQNYISDNLPIADIDKEIDEQEATIGFSLNQGQRKAVRDIILSNSSLCMLNGKAGTGKTTVTKVILNIYKKYGRDNFKLCALSGRASSVLGESSGYMEYASTIHRTIGKGIDGGSNYYNYNEKFEYTDVVIIDEISMIDFSLLYEVLCAIPNGAKIILLGDSRQLPSLFFGKTIETMTLYDIQFNELTQVMRQSEESKILSIANDVSEKRNPFENTKYKWYGEDTEVCIGNSYNYMLDTFLNYYKEDKQSSIIVTTTKAKVDKINFDIQNMLIEEKLINTKMPSITKPSSTKGKVYKMYVGNHIMILKNYYESIDMKEHELKDFLITEEQLQYAKDEGQIRDDDNYLVRPYGEKYPIFNGEIFKIEDILENGMILEGLKGDRIYVDHELIECQLAYSATCHKMQGSGFPNVFVYHTSDWVDKKMMVNHQLLYTAYTRAKKKLHIHTDAYTNLTQGIKTDAVDQKVTLIEYFHNK